MTDAELILLALKSLESAFEESANDPALRAEEALRMWEDLEHLRRMIREREHECYASVEQQSGRSICGREM